MALHDLLYCYVNGDLLSNNQSVETDVASDITQVKTIVRGFAGITPGAPVRMVKCKNVVPLTGFEFDAEAAMLTSQEIEIKLQYGSGPSTISRGYIVGSVGTTSEIGKTTEQNWEFVGTAAPFS